jgi:DNA replication and repair protein RecF
VATQGFSPRTRQDTQLIRFGESAGRIVLDGQRSGSHLEISVTLRHGQAKEARLNGARLASAESLRREVSTLVFTPDRLAVVKGGPAARRAYFDRVLARLFPARAAVPQDYLATLAQRNAALRRVQLGLSGRDALEPWTERIAALGAALVEQRRAVLASLAPGFTERADELGLPAAQLAYDAEPPTVESLEARLPRDIERGTTGLGPHLDDVLVASADRDLRQYGSQGEQRLAVLSLLLAEAELLPTPPLLLFDDVLSELDPGRRDVLARRVAGLGQTMITSTHRSALPIEPAQVVEVTPGSAQQGAAHA